MEIRIYIHRNFETFLEYIVNIYQGDHQLDILVSLVNKGYLERGLISSRDFIVKKEE